MVRNLNNQIPHQTYIEIKDGIMYKTAQRDNQKNSLYNVDC